MEEGGWGCGVCGCEEVPEVEACEVAVMEVVVSTVVLEVCGFRVLVLDEVGVFGVVSWKKGVVVRLETRPIVP